LSVYASRPTTTTTSRERGGTTGTIGSNNNDDESPLPPDGEMSLIVVIFAVDVATAVASAFSHHVLLTRLCECASEISCFIHKHVSYPKIKYGHGSMH
jgi:hypothetical protein